MSTNESKSIEPGLTPDEIVSLLMENARKTGAGEYEVFLMQKNAMAVGAKERKIDQLRRNEELAASVRLIDDGRLGFAYTSVFSPEALQKTVAQAAAGAALSDPEPGLALPGPPDGPYPEVEGYDPDLTRVTLEEKMAGVLEMEAVALEADPRVERVRHAEYHETEYTVHLTNSHGLKVQYSGTFFSGSVMVKAAEGEEAEMGYEGDSSRTYKGLDMAKIGREAAQRALCCLGGRKVRGGRGPIILENRVIAEFIEILISSFLADNTQKGKSLLTGKLGQPIMSPTLTLVDDGLYPGGISTAPSDDEGVPCQRTVLVDGGFLNSFLYDVPRARVDGVESTGNAGRAGAKTPPGVSSSNLILSPGSKTLDELMSELGEGLLVTEVLGAHTANPISGDFSLGVNGGWIKNGRIEHPVKGMALAGNIIGMLGQVALIGSDLRMFGSVGAPSLLIEGLTLSGL